MVTDDDMCSIFLAYIVYCRYKVYMLVSKLLAPAAGVASTTMIYEVRRSITRSTTLMNTRDRCIFGRRQIAALSRVDAFLFIDSVLQ